MKQALTARDVERLLDMGDKSKYQLEQALGRVTRLEEALTWIRVYVEALPEKSFAPWKIRPILQKAKAALAEGDTDAVLDEGRAG